jgi:hypothetical protein
MNTDIRYGLDANQWIEPNDPIWNEPLPDGSFTEPSRPGSSPTYGELLMHVEAFVNRLCKDDRNRLGGSDGYRKNSFKPDIAKPATIRLVKHGACYHVCRVVTPMLGGSRELAVNVATNPAGIAIIEQDFRLMAMHSVRCADPVVPKVFRYTDDRQEDGKSWAMFAAEWLTGFHEFHRSFDAKHNRFGVQIWDTDTQYRFLSPRQERSLYRRIAKILTLLYDIQTGAEVHPWHHAAGDFVARQDRRGLQVRLITIRGYTPLSHLVESDGPEAMLHRLLIFLCNLSIRNRLDRIDGVGDLCWADEMAVAATAEGFFDGLSVHAQAETFPDGIANAFLKFTRAIDPVMIYEICDQIVDSYPPNAPEVEIIRQNLVDHAGALYCAMNDSASGGTSYAEK